MTKQINQKSPHWLDGHFALITASAGENLGGALVKVSGVVGETIFGEVCNSKGKPGALPLMQFNASQVVGPFSPKIGAAFLFSDLKTATEFAAEAEITLITDGPIFAKGGDQTSQIGA